MTHINWPRCPTKKQLEALAAPKAELSPDHVVRGGRRAPLPRLHQQLCGRLRNIWDPAAPPARCTFLPSMGSQGLGVPSVG